MYQASNVLLTFKIYDTVHDTYEFLKTVEAPVELAVDWNTKELFYITDISLKRWNSSSEKWEILNNAIQCENYAEPWGGGFQIVNNSLYITQGPVNSLTVFNKSGALLNTWGGVGVIEGNQVSFNNPKGLQFDSNQNIYVCDAASNRIVKLENTYNCLPGFYGSQCTPCSCPVNSACDDGVTGTGTYLH